MSNSQYQSDFYCSGCNAPAYKGDRFCSKCGAIFSEIETETDLGVVSTTDGKSHCPNCHTALTEKAKFCNRCGFEIRGINEGPKSNFQSDQPSSESNQWENHDISQSPQSSYQLPHATPDSLQLFANKSHDGLICKLCNNRITIGSEIIQCEGCKSFYHKDCWLHYDGCNTNSCLSGKMFCRSCGKPIMLGANICRYCGQSQASGEAYHGPKIPLPGASEALTYAIIGIFCCGFILGPIAISKGNSALREYDRNPEMYEGKGGAPAAVTIGWIALVLNILGFLIKIASIR